MAQTQTEREDKYDVEPSFVLPSLERFVPEGGQVVTDAFELEAVYFDTSAADLRRARITLRRRRGGTDAGWHLKLPAGAARTELHLPYTTSSVVPKEFTDLTLGLRRGRQLRRVAVLRTHRSVHRLFDVDGQLLAEIADDVVHATAFGEAAIVSSWREVEVELGTGDDALLARIGKRLRKAGAVVSPSVSKVGRALGPAPDRAVPSGPLADYMHAQFAALDEGDLALRRDLDVIHPTRVATRRLRSTLRIYGRLFDADRALALDTELKWYAGLLGDVRDQEVLAKRMQSTLAGLPPEMVLGPVVARITEHLIGERGRHLITLRRAMNGRRYLALLSELDRWREDPPLVAAPSRKAVLAGLARAERKVARKLDIAFETDVDEDLHAARKAGKRARYAAELATPLIGAHHAKLTVARYTTLQDLLGEHQDAVVAGELMRTLGARAGVAKGENGFTYGVLWAMEQRRALDSRDAAAVHIKVKLGKH